MLAASSLAQAAGGSPVGQVNEVFNGSIYYSTVLPTIGGWAADPDRPLSPISVHVDVAWTKQACSRFGCITRVVASDSLTQTADRLHMVAFGWGSTHGFSFSVPPAPVPTDSYDSEQACITAINVGAGSNTSLGCPPLVYQPIY